MKFEKGLLSDLVPKSPSEPQVSLQPPIQSPRTEQKSSVPDVDKNRLFETVEKTRGSSRKYAGVLAVVGVLVVAAGAVLWYLNRPTVGDRVKVSPQVELALYDHFLIKEKRSVENVSFYLCDGFYWARVNVETRTDIANPLMRIPTYKARIVKADSSTTITASPINTPADDQPCS